MHSWKGFHAGIMDGRRRESLKKFSSWTMLGIFCKRWTPSPAASGLMRWQPWIGFMDFREARYTVARAARTSNPQRATEAPATIIGLRTIVTDEDAIVTTITINRAA